MKKLYWLGITVLTAALSSTASAVPDRIGDFGLLDSDGDFHQLSRYRHKEALVLMSFDSSCRSIDSSIAQLQAMQANWVQQGIVFALINSSSDTDIDAIRAAKAARGIDLPLLIDEGQLVSETLSMTKAGEIEVLYPERLTLLYR